MYLKKGDLKQAKRNALMAIEISPKYSTYYILSCIYRKEGNTAKADSLRAMALQSADDHYRLMVMTDMWNEKKSRGEIQGSQRTGRKDNSTERYAGKHGANRQHKGKNKQAATSKLLHQKKIAKQKNKTSLMAAIAITIALIMGGAVYLINRKRNEAQAETKKANTDKNELAGNKADLEERLKCMEAETQGCKTTAEKDGQGMLGT